MATHSIVLAWRIPGTGEPWWAAVYGVAQSQTQLKWLSSSNSTEVQPVHPKGDQSWVFIGRTDVEAETPILWPPDAKSWLIGKDPDAGKDWGQEEKGMTEDEMAGWHHWLNGHEFGWTPGVGDEYRGLACCGSWGYKEWNATEKLNWSDETLLFSYLWKDTRWHQKHIPLIKKKNQKWKESNYQVNRQWMNFLKPVLL